MTTRKNISSGFPIWRIGLFLLLLIFHSQAKLKNNNNTQLSTYSEDSLTLILNVENNDFEQLKKLIKKNIKIKRFDKQLDSLGYFNSSIQKSNDTLFYILNKRVIIDTILTELSGESNLTFEHLIADIKFPIPYNSKAIDQISRNTINYCASKGYPFSKISISFKEYKNFITPILKINTEKRYCFESPLINRSLLLNFKTLKNDLLIKKGDIFNLSGIEETVSRLKQRPYINSVIAKEPVIIPESHEAKKTDTNTNCPNSVTVPLEIVENSGMGIDGILGYSSAKTSIGWNGQVNIILQNVLHRGEALTLNYRGEENFQQFSLTLDKAYPFAMPFLFSGFFDLEVLNEKYGSLKGGLDLLTSLRRNLQIGFGITGHEPTLEDGSSWYLINFDLLLRIINSTYGAGIKSGKLDLRTGSGYRDQNGEKNGIFSFKLSTEGQYSFLNKHALYGRLFSALITTAQEELHETEMIRVGGHNSLRGYAIDEYSFTACAFLQFEYRFYFLKKGSLFIFADGGVGSQNEINVDNSTSLFGYGLGVRVPVKLGRLSLEYARNYKEGRSPGRIHVRIQNSLSKGM